MRDAAHHAFDNAAVAGHGFRRRESIVNRSETNRVHHRDGPRAHGEDVAQDAAHAGGRALKRLDEARMIVRFDLEGDDVAGADIDDAGVLARPLHHALSRGRQLLQMQARALVGAVLAPHHAEDAELGVAGLAAQDRDDLFVFGVRELMQRDQIRRDCAHECTAAAATMDWKITIPSVDPCSGSVASSGCGIKPSTLRSRLRMPAMSRSEPLGLSR